MKRQVYALMAYYMALLVICIALILFLIWWGGVPLDVPSGTPNVGTPEASRRVLATMALLVSGAVVGSVLYHIRMLFRFYIKSPAFDSRWLVKYVSAPLEAAGLALAIVSILESGAVALGVEEWLSFCQTTGRYRLDPREYARRPEDIE